MEERLPLGSLHGHHPLRGLYERDCSHLERVTGDPRLGDFCPSRALFLDIEASGLEHGAGTLAFLVGLGYVDGSEFVVRQLLLSDPSDEGSLLALLVPEIERFPYLISFNGKSYDLSVLQTRLVLNRFYSRRECDLKLRPHLDLLHISRNLYRGLWEDTKLQTLERRHLGFERVGDVPGSLVPTCWYHFLRTGDAAPIAGVVTHNRHDVLSMVTLADRVIADSLAPDDVRSRINLGRLLLRRRAPADSLAVLRDIRDHAPSPSWERDGLATLAVAARRCGDHATARSALEGLVERCPDDAAAHQALAIHLERTARELSLALEHALDAHRLAPSDASDRRVARLQGRIARGCKPPRSTGGEPEADAGA